MSRTYTSMDLSLMIASIVLKYSPAGTSLIITSVVFIKAVFKCDNKHVHKIYFGLTAVLLVSIVSVHIEE